MIMYQRIFKKANIEKLYRRIIKKSSNQITVAEDAQTRYDVIQEIKTHFLKEENECYFKIQKGNLENEINKTKKKYRELQNKKRDAYSSYYSSLTEEEYVDRSLYHESNMAEIFILEKYKPTEKKEKEVLVCDFLLSRNAQSQVMFAVYFNQSSQLCLDFILKKKREDFYIKSIEKDINIESTTTSTDAIKELLNSLPAEVEIIKKANEKQEQINEKNRIKTGKVKALSNKAMIAKINSILDEKKISHSIHHRANDFQVFLKMKKGTTMIKIPKRNAKNSLDLLLSLCEIVLAADQYGIQCRYQKN